jgi:hypothetical protein
MNVPQFVMKADGAAGKFQSLNREAGATHAAGETVLSTTSPAPFEQNSPNFWLVEIWAGPAFAEAA